jgi:hypothetical protein
MIHGSGGCLCGKVRYKISQAPVSQGICYCRQCQKTGGAYGSPMLVLPKSALEYTHGALSVSETKSDRGSTVKRNFCKECGCHVFALISDIDSLVTLRANTLDDFSLFAPEYLVFTKSVGPSCVLPAGVPAFLEGAPLGMVLGGGNEVSIADNSVDSHQVSVNPN